MTPNQSTRVYGHPIRINSLGFRGPDLDVPKKHACKRVVFIGDSVTYGGGRIREEQLFCRIVAGLARRDGIALETLNLSAPAWSPQNWIEYIEEYGLHEADVVVLVLPECDLARPFMTMSLAGHRTESSPLRVGNLLHKAHAITKGSLSSGGTVLANPSVRAAKLASANASAVARLRQVVGKAPFLSVLIPSGHSEFGAFWPEFEPHLFDVLDLRNGLESAHFMDGAHLSTQGHAIVAAEIYPKIVTYLTGGISPAPAGETRMAASD